MHLLSFPSLFFLPLPCFSPPSLSLSLSLTLALSLPPSLPHPLPLPPPTSLWPGWLSDCMNNVLPFVMKGGKGEKRDAVVVKPCSHALTLKMNDSLPACQSSSDWHWADSTAYTPPHSRWRQPCQAPPTSSSSSAPRFSQHRAADAFQCPWEIRQSRAVCAQVWFTSLAALKHQNECIFTPIKR